MKRILIAAAALALASSARAEVHHKVIEYKHGDVVLEGYFAWDDAVKDKRPGVLVIHEWTGHNAYARKRADMLAALGYPAFALDMYGKGVTAKNPQEAAAMAKVYKDDRKLMRGRAAAGLAVLKEQEQVDPAHIAAIGYCFGGTCTLELARSGAELDAVVSFHGDLSTPTPEDAKNIRGRLLALHGADDPFVPAPQVADFEAEMRNGKVDWQLVKYGNAVHGFTNPGAGGDNSKGAAYNEKADKRSWQAMRDLFAEVFGKHHE